MPSADPPHSAIAEQFRQQFRDRIDQLWMNEWTHRSAGEGRRWFERAWWDTRCILDHTPPVENERLERYATRVRDQLRDIEWQYAYGAEDADGIVDTEGWYAGVIYTIIGAFNRMEFDLLEAQR